MKRPVRFAVLTSLAISLTTGLALSSQAAEKTMSKSGNGGMSASTTSETQKCTLKPGDKRFLEQMSQVNILEQKLGELAQSRAQSEDVKSYGQRLVKDHGENEDELKNLCQSKNMAYPSNLDRANQSKYDKLEKLSGAAFDRAYISEMIKGHKQALQLAKNEERLTRQKDLKDYSSKTASAIDEHLKLAQDTDKKIIGEGAAGKKTTASSQKAKSGAHY